MWDDRRSAPWHCIAGMKEDCLIYPSGRGGIMSYGESSCLLAAHGPDAGLEERCLTSGSQERLPPRGGPRVLSLWDNCSEETAGILGPECACDDSQRPWGTVGNILARFVPSCRKIITVPGDIITG